MNRFQAWFIRGHCETEWLDTDEEKYKEYKNLSLKIGDVLKENLIEGWQMIYVGKNGFGEMQAYKKYI